MNFNFFLPTRLITGRDCVKTHSHLFKQFGDRCLLVISGSAAEKSGALQDVTQVLEEENISYQIHNTVLQNPLLEDAYIAGKTAREMKAEFVIGIGGGSPLDASKAVAIYGANDIPLMEVFENNWENEPLPIIAIGTTAGTGSEVTQYAVMTQPDGTKRSISHSKCFPTITFGDAKYTESLSLPFTVSTGLDALSHAVEGYYNTQAGALSDLCALEAIRVLVPALKSLTLYHPETPISSELRERLYYGSVVSGFSLAQVGTTYCHALGYFLSEEYDIPHGIACAVFLPGFLRRQGTLLPEKTQQLEKQTGWVIPEIIRLIEELTPAVNVSLPPEKIQEIVQDKKDTGNLAHTAPEGLSPEEATEILTDIFNK